MRKSKKVGLLLVACLGTASATAYASGDKDSLTTVSLCDVIPFACGVSPQGGNGDGREPKLPPKKPGIGDDS